jgi:hypothetical protein
LFKSIISVRIFSIFLLYSSSPTLYRHIMVQAAESKSNRIIQVNQLDTNQAEENSLIKNSIYCTLSQVSYSIRKFCLFESRKAPFFH